MYQQLWGYKIEEKLYLGVREQKLLNTTAVEHVQLIRQIIPRKRQPLNNKRNNNNSKHSVQHSS
jgi:hypothetical protein